MTFESSVVLLPDYQVPEHHPGYVMNLHRMVGDLKPSRVGIVGDFLDAPEPSRWNKGMAGEYERTLQRSIDQARSILTDLRQRYDGPIDLRMGNHDERVETYVARYAPALSSLAALRFEALIDADNLGITVHRQMVDIAPGWVMAHGHEGGLRSTGGLTAAALAARIGKSVVCGHTHKVALVPSPSGPQGYNGRQANTLWGMEVGHAMDIRKAAYLKTGSATWQKGFGVLHVRGRVVQPEVVVATHNGQFGYGGRFYA